MNWTTLPIFILQLMAIVAITLSSHTYFYCHFDGGIVGGMSTREGPQLPTTSESTLLRLASNYISDTKYGAEIEQLLKEDFSRQAQSRTFDTWHMIIDHRQVSSSSVGSNILPVTINGPRFYRYWLDFRRNLHDLSRKRRFDNEIMLHLVEIVKHPIDVHIGGSGGEGKYKSCAVVGNSGILLERDYGELIDGHAVVIRLNNTMIKGFKRSVDSRTTISFVNSNILRLYTRNERCYCHPYGADIPIVMFICQPMHLLDYTV